MVSGSVVGAERVFRVVPVKFFSRLDLWPMAVPFTVSGALDIIESGYGIFVKGPARLPSVSAVLYRGEYLQESCVFLASGRCRSFYCFSKVFYTRLRVASGSDRNDMAWSIPVRLFPIE
jgi:hypothetical protein